MFLYDLLSIYGGKSPLATRNWVNSISSALIRSLDTIRKKTNLLQIVLVKWRSMFTTQKPALADEEFRIETFDDEVVTFQRGRRNSLLDGQSLASLPLSPLH